MGRGASKAGKRAPYGTEFHSVYHYGRIKFVKPNSGSTTAPMYTKTKGRIYATLDDNDEVKYITTYGKTWKVLNEGYNRTSQIDLSGPSHIVNGVELKPPHTHYGYRHEENGTAKPTAAERKIIDKVLTEWYNHKHKSS